MRLDLTHFLPFVRVGGIEKHYLRLTGAIVHVSPGSEAPTIDPSVRHRMALVHGVWDQILVNIRRSLLPLSRCRNYQLPSPLLKKQILNQFLPPFLLVSLLLIFLFRLSFGVLVSLFIVLAGLLFFFLLPLLHIHLDQLVLNCLLPLVHGSRLPRILALLRVHHLHY